MVKNLFIITARSGSKGIKDKNIIELAGMPLLAYKAISAQKSNYCDRLIISTDSKRYAEIAEEFGVEVPFLRPDYLSGDEVGSNDVLLHAIDWIEHNDDQTYDAITLLEPSSPFATYQDINNAFTLFKNNNAISVLGVKKTISTNFIAPLEKDLRMIRQYEKIKNMQNNRRQDVEQEYTLNGALYICDVEYFKMNKMLHSHQTYGYIMSDAYSLEIDDLSDLDYARYLVEKGIINKEYWK